MLAGPELRPSSKNMRIPLEQVAFDRIEAMQLQTNRWLVKLPQARLRPVFAARIEALC